MTREQTPAKRGAPGKSVARLAAVQALFQAEFSNQPVDLIENEFLSYRLGEEVDGTRYHEADRKLFSDVLRGAGERLAEIDRTIAEALDDSWPFERLDSSLRAILRAGTYELLARPDVPAGVVVSEYVDIAWAFFSGAEPGFANGVLDRLARNLRPGELSSDDDKRRQKTR